MNRADDRAMILGIDPGLASTGIGIIRQVNEEWKFVYASDVKTTPAQPMPIRLEKIHDLVKTAIDEFHPDCISVESIFFAKNVKSAVQMAHGRGVGILAAHQSGIEVFEYSPLEIKQSVVGKGRATKNQVMKMIEIILGIDTTGMSDHKTDALACALAHAYRRRLVTNVSEVPKSRMDNNDLVEKTDADSATKNLLAESMKSRKRKRRR